MKASFDEVMNSSDGWDRFREVDDAIGFSEAI